MIGKKRLASMPDRVTNTITTLDQGIVTRPTVINCYEEGDLGSLDRWWAQWSEFIFTKKISINKKGVTKTVRIYELMSPIKNAKYPAITLEEVIVRRGYLFSYNSAGLIYFSRKKFRFLFKLWR